VIFRAGLSTAKDGRAFLMTVESGKRSWIRIEGRNGRFDGYSGTAAFLLTDSAED